jgi:uncharacterized protein YbjT (DUF2867 family)
MRILVTGVSGFVGAMLAPRLLADGHQVRALTREPARAAHALAVQAAAHPQATTHPEAPAPRAGEADSVHDPTSAIAVVRGDVLTGEGLAQALDGIEVAYYLVHSMESPPAGTAHERAFPERERLGAVNFATAARDAGVERIVYLGGLVPQDPAQAVSRHLASREAVQEILLEHVPDSVALRSAIVIGARSRSFRLLVQLVERLPVLALPPWRRSRTQPIDARDMIEMLLAAAHLPAVAGRALDVGGPEALTYEELIKRIAELLLLPRPTLAVKVRMTPLTARLAAALAGEDPELFLAMMDGLESDLLPAADHAAELLGVQLHPIDAAIECALREWEAVEPLAAR